jgi:hypothetical protein
MFRNLTISYLLPSYARAQALALESLASPPSWIVFRGYHPKVRALINYEALEDVLDFFLSLGVDHWVYEPNGWS